MVFAMVCNANNNKRPHPPAVGQRRPALPAQVGGSMEWHSWASRPGEIRCAKCGAKIRGGGHVCGLEDAEQPAPSLRSSPDSARPGPTSPLARAVMHRNLHSVASSISSHRVNPPSPSPPSASLSLVLLPQGGEELRRVVPESKHSYQRRSGGRRSFAPPIAGAKFSPQPSRSFAPLTTAPIDQRSNSPRHKAAMPLQRVSTSAQRHIIQ